jgi:Ca2+-binding RTX toxin-like protein
MSNSVINNLVTESDLTDLTDQLITVQLSDIDLTFPDVVDTLPLVLAAIVGTDGSDYLQGGDANDVILGLAGNDDISGGRGNDDIDGGTGNDLIYGGSGKDTLTGGSGSDIFTFYDLSFDGVDIITDFDIDSDSLEIYARDFGFENLPPQYEYPPVVLNIDYSNHSLDGQNALGSIAAGTPALGYDIDNGGLYVDRDGSATDFSFEKFAQISPVAAGSTIALPNIIFY